LRLVCATLFVSLISGPWLWCQQSAIEPQTPPTAPLLRPYVPRIIPPVRLGNSARLAQFLRDGKLYLTAQDAIALALDNNVDMEVSRYSPLVAEWQVVRAQAGGPLPGVPSSASLAGSVASGQGIAGSQAAAGVTNVNAQASNRGTNATVSQVGPVVQTLDPSLQMATTFAHASNLEPNATQTETSNLISGTRAYTAGYSEGFLTGGNVSLGYTDHYLNENTPTDVLNPSVAPGISVSAQQNLLNGFGIALNSRNIMVARIGLETAGLNFRNQVSSVTAQVLNAYYTLSADYLSVKAAQDALDVARTFEKNVRRQIELGSAAGSDLITARSQTATAEQTAADAKATLETQDLQLKSLISRNIDANPILAAAPIVPTDQITIPERDDLPSIPDLVKEAFANRPDLAVDKNNERSSEVSALGTRNGLLPTLQVGASTSQNGLAGVSPSGQANSYYVGGIGTALGQVFRRNFPTNSASAVLYAPIGNHQAQADYAVDQLQLRQTQLATRKDFAQVQVDIMNAVIAMQQARAQYEAAVHNRILQEQLFAGEQKKYAAGTETPFLVTQQERDLVNAQSQERAALAAYSTARISLDLTRGTILQTYHISIADALAGRGTK
jgi:outer membrane protein TolC